MKHKILYMLFLWILMPIPIWAQGGGYNPTNPGDPDTPINTQKHKLTLTASPKGSCSFNYSSLQQIEEGTKLYLTAYVPMSYEFVAWLCDGDTLSHSHSFYYTMPKKDVELCAVLRYNPTSPGAPDSPLSKYTVNVKVEPVNGGRTSFSREKFDAGTAINLYAYPNNGFQLKGWMVDDKLVTDSIKLRYVVPEKESEVVALFDYNPKNPANPCKNYWDKKTGDLIVDEFEQGYLNSAISNALQSDSYNLMQTLTVAGKMNDSDFGLKYFLTNCSLVDLSRTSGYQHIPSFAFSQSKIENLYLPSCIERIEYAAFRNCDNLSSITLYAMTPPKVENYAFEGVNDGFVVYVPASSLSLYQGDKAWTGFNLMPIQEDIRTLEVSLPQGIDDQLYKQMWIELTNAKSGQKMHYVMTGRKSYTFTNLIKNTTWNVTLRNQHGDIFAQINNVEVKDEDVKISFDHIAVPQEVKLSILTPDGSDVTRQILATWTDTEGNYLAQGFSMSGLLAGSKLTYKLSLPEQLATQYAIPTKAEYTVTEQGNTIQVELQPLQVKTMTGKVIDCITKTAISGAIITASQTFDGKYTKTISGKTDIEGNFSIDITNVPTQLTIAATDYVSESINNEDLLKDDAVNVKIGEISLKPISGATISLTFNYKRCSDDESASTSNWFCDYQNVRFRLYNKTKKKDISQYQVQYPQIVLLEEVSQGDQIELTATSKTDAFMPSIATATINDKQQASATFNIAEFGKIQAFYSKNNNASVVGSLYDASGNLKKTSEYSNATLTFNNLADGYYTLLSMGKSKLFNTIYKLGELKQSGLKEGNDYVLNTIKVESGNISRLSINEIPTLNESKFYFTGDNTSFTANKQSIVAGNYLTLTGKVDFKLAYAKKVRNVSLLVDIPESCTLVENSVMVGNSISNYSLNGNRLTIPMGRYTDRVRFCVIPTLGGDYNPSAQVEFELNGKTITQPIGSASYTAKDLSINVPKTVAKSSVSISGMAAGRSEVKVYDDNVLIGQTTSLANGMWSTKCELNDAYNLSQHDIHAKVTTKQGLELQSETQQCLYDENAIQIKTVDMSFYNGWMHKNLNVTFDFENNKTSESSYSFYTSTDFTFVADLTNNDTAKVKGVTLYVYTSNNEIRTLETKYDKNQDRWVATSHFDSNNLPVNVSASIDAAHKTVFDIEKWKEMVGNFNAILDTYRKNEKTIKSFFESSTELSDEEIAKKIEELGLDVIKKQDTSNLEADIENMSEEELKLYLEKEYKEGSAINDSLQKIIASWQEMLAFDINKEYEFTMPNGVSFKLKKTNTFTKEQLLADGFECYVFNDSSEVFMKTTAHEEIYVDLKNGIYLEVLTATADKILTMRADGKNAFREYAEKGIEKINKVVEYINTTFNGLLESAGQSTKLLEKAIEEIEFRLQKADIYIKNAGKKGMTAQVFKWRIEKALLTKNLFLAKDALKAAKGCFKYLFKALPIVGYLSSAIDLGNKLKTLINYYYAIPDPCPEDAVNAEAYKKQCYTYAGSVIAIATADLLGSFSADAEIIAGIVGSIASAGTSFTATAWGVVQKGLVKIGRMVFDWGVDKLIDKLGKDIASLKCKTNLPNPDAPLPPFDPINPIHDPSGYVYEAVASNRVEGVTATCYYKETVEDMYGDPHENIVKWNAEEYAQENPLFTDENGMYRWDVPQGMWQVKFEKEGYETAYSEWLPVPPPQLEVNIGIQQNIQPLVKSAKAFDEAIELEFDKYMMTETLNNENIIVMDGDKSVKTHVKYQNLEASGKDTNMKYASKVRIETEKPFESKEVKLMVSNHVKSYAGIRMQDDFAQTFAIEPEVTKIVCDSIVNITHGEPTAITLSILPASAAAGKKLLVNTSSAMMLSMKSSQITIGEDGKAELILTGELPGTASLTYNIEGYDIESSSIVKIGQVGEQAAALPTASIASGSEVTKGCAISLACETEGATIYYTLDGSCPCLNTEARMQYDGTPVIINETTVLKIMATAEGMADSDVAEYTYVVSSTSGVSPVTVHKEGKAMLYNINGQRIDDANTKGIIVKKGYKYMSK